MPKGAKPRKTVRFPKDRTSDFETKLGMQGKIGTSRGGVLGINNSSQVMRKGVTSLLNSDYTGPKKPKKKKK